MEVRLAPPWVTYVRKVRKLFEGDNDVLVSYDDEEKALTLRVTGTDKAEALAYIVPLEVKFGNVTLKVRVVPANASDDIADIMCTAFDGNGAFSDVVTVTNPVMGEVTYAMFMPEVVQFPNDDTSDAHGMTTMTYEQVARDVLDVEGVFLCSDLLAK